MPLQQVRFHGSWPAGALIAGLLRQARSPGRCLLPGWARVVESQPIRVHETTLPATGADTRIALGTEPHPGICRDSGSVDRLMATAGFGETGLPLRLFNPPTIDILELRP